MIGLDYLTNVLSSILSLSTVEFVWAIAGIMVISSIGVIIIDCLRFIFTGNFNTTLLFNEYNTAWTLAIVAIFYFSWITTDPLLSSFLVFVGAIASRIGFFSDSSSNGPDNDLLADPLNME